MKNEILRKAYNSDTNIVVLMNWEEKLHYQNEKLKNFYTKKKVFNRFWPLIRKFKRRRTYVLHTDDQWQAYLIFFKISKYNDEISYLLTVIYCFRKCAWAIPIKRKIDEEVKKSLRK